MFYFSRFKHSLSKFPPWIRWCVALAAVFAVGVVFGRQSGIVRIELQRGFATESNGEVQEEYVPVPAREFLPGAESKRIEVDSGRLLTLISSWRKASGSARSAALDEVKRQAKARRARIEETLRTNPASAFANFFPPPVLKNLPAEIEADVEKPVVVEGKFEVLHKDDFQNRAAEFEYFLRTERERFNFYPAGPNPGAAPGAKVRVQGYRLGKSVVAGTGSATLVVLAPPPVESIGEQRTLVLLVNFLDSPSPPFTKEEASRLIFDGPFQAFYREASYGKTWWSGDVIGWHTVPRNGINEVGFPLWPQWFFFDSEGALYDPDGIYAFIKQSGVNPRDYGRVVFLAYHPNMGGGFSGVGKWEWPYFIDGEPIRLSQSWVGTLDYYSQPSFWGNQPFSWTNLDYILAHELGHALGVVHANSWECGTRKILYGVCSHQEYGNFYDVMGNLSRSLHLNAFFKDALGWASDSSLIISKSGTYTLNALETQSGARIAKIFSPYVPGTPYYLEYRQPIGFDANLDRGTWSVNQKGLFINWIPRNIWAPFSRLLDISPGTSDPWDISDWDDVTLRESGSGRPVGQTPSVASYTDAGRGITLGPVLAADKQKITFNVRVSRPSCVANNPYVQIWNDYLFTSPGTSNYVNFSVENLDSPSCKPSSFQVTASGPRGWSFTVGNPAFGPLQPEGDAVWNWIIMEIPKEVSTGEYKVDLLVKNMNTRKVTSKTITVRVAL